MIDPAQTWLQLYHKGFVETVFNSRDPKRRASGWTLKSGVFSPWYINLRPLGAEPDLALDVARALAWRVAERCPGATGMVGIDMAGVPLAALTSAVFREITGRPMPFLYTRPLPGGGKVRNRQEAQAALAKLREGGEIAAWGGHALVEGRLKDGDRLVLIDDVATSFASKEIAQEWVRFEAERQGLSLHCDDAVVVADRGQGAREEAQKAGMRLFSVISVVPEGLDALRPAIGDAAHALLREYAEQPAAFADTSLQRDWLARAAGAAVPGIGARGNS